MFCGKCGNQLPEGVQFCPKCGARRLGENIDSRPVVKKHAGEPVIGTPTWKTILIGGGTVLAVAIMVMLIVVLPLTRFDINGSWVVTDSAWPDKEGEVVYFKEPNTNFWWSPMDSYALEKENGAYKLYVTPFNASTMIFDVTVTDKDHILLTYKDSNEIKMERVK